jgi:hypothetical protein
MGYETLLEAIGRAEWGRAEDATLDLLHSGRFRDPRERAKTAIVLAQARILGRLDARGAFTALLSALVDPILPELEPAWLARTHMVSTFILGAPEASFLETGWLDASVHLATALVRHPADDDLRALAGVALLGGGVVLPPADRVERYFVEVAPSLDRATEPVTRCLALEARALAAGPKRPDSWAHIEAGLVLARAIGFEASEARLSEIRLRQLDETSAPSL